MESFRIGKWEMIGWEFLPADMAVGRECWAASLPYFCAL